MVNQAKHHRVGREQCRVVPQQIDLPPPSQTMVHQQSPTGQQQQWISTNTGGTPNFTAQNAVSQQQTIQQRASTTPFANQNPSSVAENVLQQYDYRQPIQPRYSSPPNFSQSMGPTNQRGYDSYDSKQQMSTVTTTTTAQTTTQTSYQSGMPGQQYSIHPMNQVTGQMQNMQIQQPYQEPQIQFFSPQPQSEPFLTPTQPPAMQEVFSPPEQPPPVASFQPEPPAMQNQDPRYPVTIEQRQSAFTQWQSQNSKKPQRTHDRTMQEYMSGKKDKEIYETLVNQQQSQQMRNILQVQQDTQNANRQLEKAARDERRQKDREERQNEREERQREKAECEDLERQNVQRQMGQQGPGMPGFMGGLGGFGGMGGSGLVGGPMSSTTQTNVQTETVNIITQQGITAQCGENRKKAIAGGAEAIQQFNENVQAALSSIGICPMGFQWVPIADGWLCCGGNHFISEKEVDKMLGGQWYTPQLQLVNAPNIDVQLAQTMMYGAPTSVEFYPLKKPPEQLPRWHRLWRIYEQVKEMKQYYQSGQQGRQWDFSMFNGIQSRSRRRAPRKSNAYHRI